MANRREAVFTLRTDGAGPARRLFDLARPLAEHLLGLRQLAEIYARLPEDCEPSEFLSALLDVMRIRVDVGTSDLERLPRSGPVIVTANHPFGGIEGIALGRVLTSLRPDVKMMANSLLGGILELRELFLLVDPFGGPGSVRSNLASFREAIRWVGAGGALVVFPAGEVAHLNLRRGRIEDPPWGATLSGIVRHTRCSVVPAHFPGRTSLLFQALGLLHPRLRTALLARELLRRRGKPIELRVGSPIPFRQLAPLANRDEMVAYIRSRSEILSQRPSAFEHPIQPRITPRHVRPVVSPQPVERLVAEISALPLSQTLADNDGQTVYIAEASQIPHLLQEIGRVRELSFREIGEGTGREIDLDCFDATYQHLFIWHHAARELVGAYRLGRTDELIRRQGTRGLYTSTLFDFKPRLFESMGPALEMGRSFIRPEYQKSYAGLLLLWKGIGQFVVRNPRYATLFGPVSISADYQTASQRLIVAFLEHNKYAHEWSRWVRPHTPHRVERRPSFEPSLAHLRSLDDVSSFLAEIEADQKGVPVLLKQYLKLGGRLLGFNVDPAFSNVLDVLIMVDLRQTGERILARTMGREGAAEFLAHARGSRSAAS